MSAIMFETTVTAERQLHCELPLSLPIGSRVRVTVEEVVNSSRSQATGQDIKNLLAAMPDVGEDADFARPRDLGREGPEWDS